MAENGNTFLLHGATRKREAVLRQITGGRSFYEGHIAIVGPFEAGEHLEQRRFAGAVAADEPDALFLRHDPIEPLEQGLRAKVFSDCGKLNHGITYYRTRFRRRSLRRLCGTAALGIPPFGRKDGASIVAGRL